MARDLPDHRPVVARELADKGAPALCAELGIERSKTESGKYVCPRHGGGSLSVRVNRGDGMVQVRCFGCDFGGDAFALIAEVRGLSVRADFRRVLIEAATLAGLWGVVDELSGERSTGNVARETFHGKQAAPPPRPARDEPTYPDAGELAALWGAAGAVAADDAARAMLAGRGLDAGAVDGAELARVLPTSATLPAWCSKGRRSWLETGHRLLLPVYDAAGVMRSVRAWRIEGDGDAPKRLPPTGHKAGGVALANEIAIAMLAGTFVPRRVLIAEGEADYLTWATRRLAEVTAIVGVFSGAWSAELAARVPSGARVIVRTHHDASGDKYAEQINVTLRDRCSVLRPKAGT